MPDKSLSQQRLMRASAHTPGGYGGVPQSVGKDFVAADKGRPAPTKERVGSHPRNHSLAMASATHLHQAGYISGAKKAEIHAAAGKKLAMAKQSAPWGAMAPK